MNTITTKELKKGDRVVLRNGWMATVVSRPVGIRVMLKVEGLYTEIGDQYIWDVAARVTPGGMERLTLTPKQLKTRSVVGAAGF